MEKITLIELNYGEIHFLYEKIKKEMEAMGLEFSSPIKSDYIVKATLVALSNLTDEERAKVSKAWGNALFEQTRKELDWKLDELEDRKKYLASSISTLSNEIASKEETLSGLDQEYRLRRKRKEEELESSLKEKKELVATKTRELEFTLARNDGVIAAETERLHKVRSELSIARRERNDYIRKSEAIVRKAEAEAEELKEQKIREAEAEARHCSEQIESEARHRMELADRIYKACENYRIALQRVQESYEKYIAIGSLLISVFGDKVEEVANRICNTVGSSRVREAIPTSTDFALEKMREDWINGQPTDNNQF